MENLVVSTRKKLTMDKMFAQVKIVAQNPIKNVLNVIVGSQIGTCDCSGGAVSVTGKLIATMVYVNADGQVESASATTDFIEKQKAEFAMNDIFVCDEVEIENINYSSNEAMISVSHIANLEGVFNYEIPKIDASQNSLVLKSSTFSAQNIKTSVEDTFVVAEEYQTNFENATILLSNASVIASEVVAGVDKVVVSGKVLADVVYLADGNIERLSKEFDFSQEIAGNGVIPNMTADAFLCVRNAVVTTENRNDKCALVYSIELASRVFVYEESNIELAGDLYSLKNELTTTYSYLEVKNYKGSRVDSNTFSSTIDISTIDGLDDVICVYGTDTKIVDEERQNDKTVLGCKQAVCVIYKTETGIESLQEVVDFEIEVPKTEEMNLAGYDVAGEIVSFKVKAGREIELICKYTCRLTFDSEMGEKYISSYEIVGDKQVQPSGIKVYIAKEGQTLFEVAKVLNVTPETIKEQNEIDEVFEAGQKIYVYSPVNLA